MEGSEIRRGVQDGLQGNRIVSRRFVFCMYREELVEPYPIVINTME